MGRQPSGEPGPAIMGCQKGCCVVNFHFVIIIVFFEIFHSEPDRPDWQIHCLIFLVLDYMLFLKAIFIY